MSARFQPGFGSWGCLHVFCPPQNALNLVKSQVCHAYRKQGLQPFQWFLSSDLDDYLGEPYPGDLSFCDSDVLVEDEIFVLPEETSGWIAVMPRVLEWCPPMQHPLALSLSESFPVLYTLHLKDCYSEVSLYQRGSAQQCILNGPQKPPIKTPHPIDFDWFQDKGSVVPSQELAEAISDIEQFISLAGPDSRGLREAFEDAPLQDYEPSSFLVFRK